MDRGAGAISILTKSDTPAGMAINNQAYAYHGAQQPCREIGAEDDERGGAAGATAEETGDQCWTNKATAMTVLRMLLPHDLSQVNLNNEISLQDRKICPRIVSRATRP
jgi:hypothetical protein